MPTLSLIYRNMLWIAPPIFCISVALLVFFIMSVVKTSRKALLFGVPLMEEQEVEFTEAGSVVLCGEGPLLTSRFWRLGYELSSDDVAPMRGRRVLFRQTTSGFSKVKISLRVFTIPKPGRYLLRINGLGEPRDNDAEHQVVFTRPHLAKAVSCIIGITLSAALLITSLVFFLMRLAGV